METFAAIVVAIVLVALVLGVIFFALAAIAFILFRIS